MVVDRVKQTGKCGVLLNGGADSLTVAFWAKKHGYDVSRAR